jgi:small GTP-binding protein
MIRKKVLLLGDFSVGKTSLIRRFVDDSFSDEYLTTIGVKIAKKLINIDDIQIEVLVWDVEGETPLKKIPLSYYKGASGAIFVADVNRMDTVKGLSAHIDTFNKLNPNTPHVIAYNKSDLLTKTESDYLISDENIFLTSAKNAKNVESLFIKLMKDIIK